MVLSDSNKALANDVLRLREEASKRRPLMECVDCSTPGDPLPPLEFFSFFEAEAPQLNSPRM